MSLIVQNEQAFVNKTNIEYPYKLCCNYVQRIFNSVKYKRSISEVCTTYCQLSKYPWYWGAISAFEAAEILADQEDYVYLIRHSNHAHYLLAISYRCKGRTIHSRFKHSKGLFSLSMYTAYVPVSQIPDHCAIKTLNKISAILNEPMPAKPPKPYSKFSKLNSLQLLCRYSIRQTFASNLWEDLPLPPNLRIYIATGTDFVVPTHLKEL